MSPGTVKTSRSLVDSSAADTADNIIMELRQLSIHNVCSDQVSCRHHITLVTSHSLCHHQRSSSARINALLSGSQPDLCNVFSQ